MSENEAGHQAFPAFDTKPNKRSRLFVLAAVIFILILFILGGLFVLGSFQKNNITALPTPTIAASATPLPTSSVSAVLTVSLTGILSPTGGISTIDSATNLDRSKLSVVILNGSGIAGAAAQVSTFLKDLGYNVVSVGNADVFTYKNLTIQVKKAKSGYAGLLKKDLQSNADFASVSASVSDTIENDAEVIVGK